MDPPPPRKVLIAALIRRAMTDIQRVMEIRENKAALQNLLQKGQIGDDTWNHLLETEKEMDSELYEVVQEANHFRPGWGQYIFPHAGDMIQHEKNKKQFENIDSERKKMGGFGFILNSTSLSLSRTLN
jgi:translocation protein SEC66